MKHQKSKRNPRFKKSQSLIAGIIFALVFAGLFFIAIRYGDLYGTEGQAIKDVTRIVTKQELEAKWLEQQATYTYPDGRTITGTILYVNDENFLAFSSPEGNVIFVNPDSKSLSLASTTTPVPPSEAQSGTTAPDHDEPAGDTQTTTGTSSTTAPDHDMPAGPSSTQAGTSNPPTSNSGTPPSGATVTVVKLGETVDIKKGQWYKYGDTETAIPADKDITVTNEGDLNTGSGSTTSSGTVTKYYEMKSADGTRRQFESTTTGSQTTIKASDGTSYTIPAGESINIAKYSGTGNRFPTSGGGVLIITDTNNYVIKSADGTNTVKEVKNGVTTNWEITADKINRPASTTQNGITLTYNYDSAKATAPSSYTYKYTFNSKTNQVTVDKTQFNDLKSYFGDSTDIAIVEAAKAGITDYSQYTGSAISSSDGTIKVYMLGGEIVIDTQDGTNQKTIFLDSKGNLNSVITKLGDEAVAYKYDLKTNSMTIDGTQISASTTPETSGKNSGRYEVTDNIGTKLYFDGNDFYDSNGNKMNPQDVHPELIDNQAKLKQGINELRKRDGKVSLDLQRFQQTVAGFESAMTEFRGLSGFSSLFFDDKTLQNWREQVDRTFAQMYLGTDYWSSKLCAMSIDKQGGGIMYVTSPSGMIEVGAHVEGERVSYSFVNNTPRTEYLYKLAYYVSNPNGVKRRPAERKPEITFNVFVYGDRTVKLYKENIVLQEGDSFNRVGDKSVIKSSSTNYNKICVQFMESIMTADGKLETSVCNTISESQSTPTQYGTPPTSGGGSTGGGTGENDI